MDVRRSKRRDRLEQAVQHLVERRTETALYGASRDQTVSA